MSNQQTPEERRQATREQIREDQRAGTKRDRKAREREREWYRINRPSEEPPV